MPRRIHELLRHARKKYFVGREKELADFQQLVRHPDRDTVLLYVYGPGGQGKSTLIREYIEWSAGNGYTCLFLDARDFAPEPGALLGSLRQALQIGSDASVYDELESRDERTILFIDTYELLQPIDDWMRQDFLPLLPDHVLTVISGRKAPSTLWTIDAGWQQLMKTIQVRNLSPHESREYLDKRNISEAQIPRILDFTHGHPLALSVVADMLEQYPGREFRPEDSPDIIRKLLEHFVQKVPSPAHRLVLEIAALIHVTTEPLLQHVLDMEDVSELFAWLQELSFVEWNRHGLFLHEVARESLSADLQWRNPDWYRELHTRVRRYYIARIGKTTGETQRKLLFELNYLRRETVRSFFHWENPGMPLEAWHQADRDALLAMTRQWEGEASAGYLNAWLSHPATEVWVSRPAGAGVSGFLLAIRLQELTAPTGDPTVDRALTWLREKGNLRRGEVSTLFRFWMSADTYQAVSSLQSSMYLSVLQYCLNTPNLAVTFWGVSQPELRAPMLAGADMQLVPELTIRNEGQDFGFFAHDWRKVPATEWLAGLGVPASVPDGEERPVRLQVMILSEDEFYESAAEALKDLSSEKRLYQNPLLRSKIVVAAAGNQAPDAERVAALRRLLREALSGLESSPRNEKFHRVVHRTFFNPAGTSQEQIADFLRLPFSTYRRYLAKGIRALTDILWVQEEN
ncbi:hypothetical protein [Siphonobacter aquaeclarae]|uniref:AAA ATPase domain-containing protein n=1 Tax=Siphonobacter aquaeclarae TaxID=563176 RepID=A0A1G9V3M9_9BACT|nr:hypothetical protein [Siphonobacter aquaeclarae]SDM66666.1 hypothetical protein SAMN04488090_3948 [Siphonobacter aquaeclarae]